ncbi:carbohydrate-binding domain-containing protein [uncultured Proteiniphilum sp.]|uniref:carbohydrate-binding domain-containing protein n=1 Tax=uncultured Proteiniphilum sp. TaxID=497637 RepID=UPI0026154B3F|nr:carbohydrate-binding domain-containing protein [uncultured Proteiniphilum sp.]
MTKMKFLFSFVCMMSLLLISCSTDDILDPDDSKGIDYEVNEDFDTHSKDSVFREAVTIAFSPGGISINNPYSAKGVSVVETNGHVVVASTLTDTEVNYVLSGNTADGSVKIYSDYKFGLVFNGVSIINTAGPAVNIQSGKKGSVQLIEGTSNRLVDSSVYPQNSDEDMKGTFFSEGQLVFDGKGSLLVIGRYKHAICSDDYILVNNGTITVEVAAKDGIHANDYFQMDGGTLTVKALSNGIQCEEGYMVINGGTLKINSTNDGIAASYEGTDIDPYILINGGTININTSGIKGMGIKTESSLTVNNCDELNISVVGNGSKAFKTGGDMTIVEGIMTLNTTGSAFYDTDEKGISSPTGIKCDGNFLMKGGNLTINSIGSAGKGINVDKALVIDGGILSVATSGGQFRYGNDDSAAKAVKSDGNLTINGGSVQIKTSGVEAEGLESKTTLTINGGTIEVNAYDDCINAASHIGINGGNIYCYSTTNDGIDSNGTLTITGGVVISAGSTAPEEGFDCDNNTFKITGGTVVGGGGSTSTPSSNVSIQRCVIYGGSGSANQLINIQSAGTSVLTFKIPRAYSQMAFLFSSSGLNAGTTYTIYKGGNISGGTDFNGLYSGATYTGGTSAVTFTTNSMVTTVGTFTGGGGGGRM